MAEIRQDNWEKGANNKAENGRIPEGFVRHLLNLDAMPGGSLSQRVGSEKVMDASDLRLGVALGESIVFVDGSQVGIFHSEISAPQILGSISATGDLAGVQFNGQVYISGIQNSVRTDGTNVKKWAVQNPAFSVAIVAGNLAPGLYKVAVTAFGDDNEESGTDAVSIQIAEGEAIQVTCSDARPKKLYVSFANGEALYSQGYMYGTGQVVHSVTDDKERLVTDGLKPFPNCSMLTTHHGVIVGATNNIVIISLPFIPHLYDPKIGFFQFPAPVDVLVAVDGGVFVVADKTYFISDIETKAPSQTTRLNIGAVPGTGVMLPDGSAAWFTQYGLAIGGSDGGISLPNRNNYAPDTASKGAAGVVEYRGNSLVVTTMQGQTKQNNLAAGDFASLETGNEC